MNDNELIKLCLSNDIKAQNALYKKYAPKMFGVCLRYAADSELAKDYLQEGFITVFTNLHTFMGNGSFEGWLRRIFVNTSLQNIRKSDLIDYKEDISNISVEPSFNDDIIDNINAGDLINLISTLPKGFKTVVKLYAIEGYSHKEISSMLGISEEGSRSQYSRAKKSLQKLILDEFGDKYL